MKKTIKATLMAIILVAGLFILTGCGSDANSEALKSAAGTYNGQYTKFIGDPETAKDESRTFSLELNADGTGKHNRDDFEYKVKWNLDGDNFSMTETFLGASIEYTGTLSEGILHIYNGDPNNDLTCEYVYEKAK